MDCLFRVKTVTLETANVTNCHVIATDLLFLSSNHRSVQFLYLAASGGTVSHYYILLICKFIDFMSLFRHCMWFSFSVKQFPSAEFGICNMKLCIAADKNRRRVELPISVLLQTLGKLKSLQGTEVSAVIETICSLESF